MAVLVADACKLDVKQWSLRLQLCLVHMSYEQPSNDVY